MDSQTKSDQDLAQLFESEIIETTLGEITIKPFTVKHFKVAIKIAGKYVNMFSQGLPTPQIITNLLITSEEFMEDAETMVLLSCPDLTKEMLEELIAPELALLVFKALEMNSDFFIQSITMGSLNLSQRLEKSRTLGPSSSAA